MRVEKAKLFSPFCEINATKFGTKNEISHKIIMPWKKSYFIASNVSSRKSATTFGDLPDWLDCDKTKLFSKLVAIKLGLNGLKFICNDFSTLF